MTELPPFKVQFFTVSEVKVLPEETRTSKYSPLEENVGVPTGSEENWDTVTPPIPVASTVVPSLVAVAVPLWVLDDPLVELVAPVGGGGGDEEGEGDGDGDGDGQLE